MSDDFNKMMRGEGTFQGSFAETILAGQGGATFGAASSLNDMLPTHPVRNVVPGTETVRWVVRYRQFDLSDDDDVAALEAVLTAIANDPMQVLRQERMASDKEGLTTVTISWAVGEPAPQTPEPPLRVDEEGNPYKLQQQYPYPTIEDGAYPGAGDVLEPPDKPVAKKQPKPKQNKGATE